MRNIQIVFLVFFFFLSEHEDIHRVQGIMDYTGDEMKVNWGAKGT